MRWLITGGGGMLGHDLASALRHRGEPFVTYSHSELDLTDEASVRAAVEREQPDVIVNCAAFTKVDDCETRAEYAMAVNGDSVAVLADAANAMGALLVQISTDFVFDGTSKTPYEVDQPVAPLSSYGRSKLRGEEAARGANKHLILRTSWLFGVHGWNFVEAIRKQVDSGRSELRVVDDQRGCPTWTPHLADAVIRLVDSRAEGVVHYADNPACTWYDFAVEIVRQLGRDDVAVHPVTTDAFPRPARRPAYSVLSTRRFEEITRSQPASWKEGLARYLAGERQLR